MRRTQIQLDDVTYERLRNQAHARRVSMAEIIRDALRTHLGLESWVASPDSFTFVASGRSEQGQLAPVSERHDEALDQALATRNR